MQSVSRQGSGPSGGSWERLITAGAYVMLLALGALEGLVGSFQYSRALGSVPVAAVAFALLIGVTCVLGAWGMHGPLGGLLPAVGWLVATFVLAMGTAGGSVVITNSGGGQWLLYGGSVCAIAGAFTGFVRWSSPRRRVGQRGDQVWPPEIEPGGQRGSGAYASAGHAPGRQAQVSGAPRADGEAPGAGTSAPAAPGAGTSAPAAPDAGTSEAGVPGTAELDARNADARKPDG